MDPIDPDRPVDPPRPWAGAYAPGVPLDIEVPEESLIDMVESAARRFGDQVALDFYGRTTTYTALVAAIARAAEGLRLLGVGAGDRVALVLPNCPQHVVAFYAVLRLGAVVVEHNPLYTAGELSRQLADHRAEVAVVWDVMAPVVRAEQASTSLRHVVSVDLSAALPWSRRLALRLPLARARATRAALTGPAPGTVSWDRVVATADPVSPDLPRPGPHDVALLQYTGGTTGRPKGAVLTHRNLRANAAQGRAWVPGLRDGAETIYAVLPFFHVYGLTLCLTIAMSVGARLVLFPRFEVAAVLAAMRRRPATFLPAVPPIYARLAAAARDRGVELTSVRYAISGAMALPPSVVAEWESVTGGLLVEGYGMTETSPISLGNPMSSSRRPGTVGVPFPSTEIRIVDPEQPTVERQPGEPGELLIHGPQVFGGYWERPEETAATLLPGGWIRTGDVVVMDSDGFVTVVDRIKELIITGGFNVYPSEVELALRQIEGVAEAAVVGLPSERGEDVVAAVVPRPGVHLDPESVRAQVRSRLAAYKVPRRVVVVAELPQSTIGKVMRRLVREELAGRPDGEPEGDQ